MPRGRPDAPEDAAKTAAGDFFRIEVRPREAFAEVRNGPAANGVVRIDGKGAAGEWETLEWLISKRLAHIESGRLIADSDEARKVLDDLDSIPEQAGADFFRAKPRRAISDREKNDRATKFAQRLALEKNAAKKPGSR